MKKLLTKLFPKHDTGSTFAIVSLLSIAMLSAGLFISDFITEDVTTGEVLTDIAVVLFFLALSAIVYTLSKRNTR